MSLCVAPSAGSDVACQSNCRKDQSMKAFCTVGIVWICAVGIHLIDSFNYMYSRLTYNSDMVAGLLYILEEIVQCHF
jgi:hypothetical protein